MSKKCTSCGKELSDNMMFCDDCGTAVDSQAETEVKPPEKSMSKAAKIIIACAAVVVVAAASVGGVLIARNSGEKDNKEKTVSEKTDKENKGDGIVSDAEKNANDDIVVADVNGYKVSLADFNWMYYDIASSLQQYAYYYTGETDWENAVYPEAGPYEGMTMKEVARKAALDQVAQLVLAQQKAEESGITIDDIVEEANEMKQNWISYIEAYGESYESFLEESFISDYTFDKFIRRNVLMNKLSERLAQEGEACYVSDEEVMDSYIKASHVLIMIDDDTTDEQALARANEVIAKLDAGEDMAALIAEYGEDPGMTQQPYYVFTEGEMVTEFYEGAKALGDNEYSKTPVKTSYGYHVIYRFPLTSDDEGYEDVISNMEEMRSALVSQKFSDYLMELVDAAKIKVYDSEIDKGLASQQEEMDKRQQDS